MFKWLWRWITRPISFSGREFVWITDDNADGGFWWPIEKSEK